MKKNFIEDNFLSLNNYDAVLDWMQDIGIVDVSQEYGFNGELSCPFQYGSISGEVCQSPEGEFFYRFSA